MRRRFANCSDSRTTIHRSSLPAPIPESIPAAGEEEEALLDMEWAAAVAPGATIQVVIAPNSDTQSAMDYIVNRLPATRVISVSFGYGESDLPASQASQYMQYLDSYFMQAAAQRQTFLVSSGDEGARDVPDVAAVADPGGPGALIVMNGTISKQTYGGTSLSAPIWAGLFALVNQFGSPGGVGWTNPRPLPVCFMM
jgi:subtilase family serine protease